MAFSAFVGRGIDMGNAMRKIFVVLGISALLGLSPAAMAAGLTLTLKDHKFTPSEIKVPANKRVMITVINNDATPEEFDSSALKVEKVVPGKSRGVVRIGPLPAGRYPFIGEYHESTAKGVVIAE
jgi:Cupredoxin-like domain